MADVPEVDSVTESKGNRRTAVRWVGGIALWLADKLLPEMPRLGGSYVRSFIIVPVLFGVWYFATQKRPFAKVADWHWRWRDYHFMRVGVAGAVSTLVLGLAVLIVANIPAGQLRGHGRLSGAPPPPTPTLAVPRPSVLPPPEHVDRWLPAEPAALPPIETRLANVPVAKRVDVLEIKEAFHQVPIEEIGAQLPVPPLTEHEAAPYLTIPGGPPSTPSGVRVIGGTAAQQ